MATITVSAFRSVPPFAYGLVRDIRVRWALEEAGLPYEELLLDQEDQSTAAYRQLQPFGQVPAYKEDDFTLFESGAIVHHIALKSEVLMPKDRAAQARVLTWMFAALNTIEPYVQQLAMLDFFHDGESWTEQARPPAVEALNVKLADLSTYLEGRDYLDARFSAADILMTTVLQILRHTDIVSRLPVLDAYCQRCLARPAYQRALDRQIGNFRQASVPAGF